MISSFEEEVSRGVHWTRYRLMKNRREQLAKESAAREGECSSRRTEQLAKDRATREGESTASEAKGVSRGMRRKPSPTTSEPSFIGHISHLAIASWNTDCAVGNKAGQMDGVQTCCSFAPGLDVKDSSRSSAKLKKLSLSRTAILWWLRRRWKLQLLLVSSSDCNTEPIVPLRSRHSAKASLLLSLQEQEAEAAINAMNNIELDGRTIRVDKARVACAIQEAEAAINAMNNIEPEWRVWLLLPRQEQERQKTAEAAINAMNNIDTGTAEIDNTELLLTGKELEDPIAKQSLSSDDIDNTAVERADIQSLVLDDGLQTKLSQTESVRSGWQPSLEAPRYPQSTMPYTSYYHSTTANNLCIGPMLKRSFLGKLFRVEKLNMQVPFSRYFSNTIRINKANSEKKPALRQSSMKMRLSDHESSTSDAHFNLDNSAQGSEFIDRLAIDEDTLNTIQHGGRRLIVESIVSLPLCSIPERVGLVR
ncbi:uncharacterized protein LY89DRAFT_667078 [Mollisia scopiformis]|uniref:Uncharacterized protein n=1 Tax=Mollisia scopiformis TaxID=149040 RepID=A0A194XG20_MOLSC|nr:uncharacterized protein LY89DRAFT_667078 [Mollisia scopiformis]KUJ19074.1 hypothetical protein LY89DRAFT_667078 [Mollisia scopiformis]